MSRFAAYLLVYCMLQTLFSTNALAQLKTGMIVGNTYKNDHLGLELRVPDGWKISVEPDGNSDSSGPASNKDRNKHSDVPWCIGKHTGLFEISKQGSPDFPNPSLSAGADEILGGSSVTALEYLAAEKKDLPGFRLPLVVEKDVHQVTIAGVKYAGIAVKMEFAKVGVLRQLILVTIRNGYVVSYHLAYRTDEELRQLERIVQSIKYSANAPSPSPRQ